MGKRSVDAVALLLESDGPGGAETMVLQLAESLRSRGVDVCPIGPANGCGWLAGEFRRRGFVPEVFRLRRPIDPGCARDLADVFRERGVRVAHSHEFTMAVYGAAAARLAGAGHVITMHGGTHATASRRRRVALRWAIHRSHAVAAVSHGAARHLAATLGTLKPAVQVIHNGIRPVRGDGDRIRKELGLRAGEILILAVGNLYPVKGHGVLLRALHALRRDHPKMEWRLAIAGKATFDGPLDAEGAALRREAEAGGFADRLHLLGHRGDVADLLAAADVFVMPSLSEGLPIALLEAMFAGKAIVASAVGGIPEAIRPELDGVLVPAGDPDALAAALGRVLTDSDNRTRLGASAAERAAACFHVDAMTSAYQRLYDDAWSSPGGRTGRAPVARLLMR